MASSQQDNGDDAASLSMTAYSTDSGPSEVGSEIGGLLNDTGEMDSGDMELNSPVIEHPDAVWDW